MRQKDPKWSGFGADRASTAARVVLNLQKFADAVRLARAEARGAAEVEVRQKDPKFWLTHADPEWTEVKRLEITGRDGAPIQIAPPLSEKEEREQAIKTLRIMHEVGIIKDERDDRD